MPKEKKPGWQYFRSDFFKEKFAIHEETGWVYFEKGAKYSPEELKLLDDNNLQLDMATHNVKTVIGGELVEIKMAEKPIETVQGEFDIF